MEDNIVQPTVQSYSTHDNDLVVLSKTEKEKLLKEMYEQGKFDALADLEKDGKAVLSREEYAEYVELRNSEVAELVKENKVLGKQCLDWMKLYHKQLTKTKEARKETTREILKETEWLFRFCGQLSYLEQLAKEYGVEIKE
jgi:hypothetical protein